MPFLRSLVSVYVLLCMFEGVHAVSLASLFSLAGSFIRSSGVFSGVVDIEMNPRS